MDSYWSLPLEDLYRKLNSSPKGLTSHETLKRLRKYGPNELAKKKKHSLVILFFTRFLSPLILILIGAGILSFLLGDRLDATIIVTMILASVLIDFIQRFRSEKSAEKLKQKVSVTATVLRDGEKKEISMSHLVAGDVVFLSAGDIVPADCRLIEEKDLFVNQSVLTGESMPVAKTAWTVSKKEITIAKLTNSVLMGTNVVSGSALGLVVNTGKETEFGKISVSLTVAREQTEFDRGINKFSQLILQVTLILVLFVFFFHAFLKQNVLDSFLFSLALAVGLTPEMLPMIIAINLSRGALQMSKHGVIVKDLMSIQNFGSIDVLCTDKTGTLTEDKIKLERYENADGREDEKVLRLAYLNSFFQTGLKSPLDDAILAHGEVSVSRYAKADEIPFDFSRKKISIIVKRDGAHLLITKGAVENILQICTLYLGKGSHEKKMTQEVKEKIIKRLTELSKEGFRVLAVAFKNVPYQKVYKKEEEENLTFMGLIAFLDPPKITARESLKNLQNQGVKLKILTGDNQYVTKKICDELDLLVNKDEIVTGEKIDTLDSDALSFLVNQAVIFASLTPRQKNRIIQALKKQGHVVGYLGDGINDAPPLKSADIGISVNNAVDVAKETADIILLTKSLHALERGVYEGRKTYANVMKYILMGTSSNFGNMFSVAGASLFLPFLPMLPKQIILNNFLYDISQTTLAFDLVDEEMVKKPKKWNIEFIKHFMLFFGPLSSLFDYLTFFMMWFLFKASVPLFQTAWFIESLVSQALIIFVIRTRKVPFFKSQSRKILIVNVVAIVIFVLLAPFISPLASLFSFEKPPFSFYIVLAGIIAVYFYLSEGLKQWFYKRYEL